MLARASKCGREMQGSASKACREVQGSASKRTAWKGKEVLRRRHAIRSARKRKQDQWRFNTVHGLRSHLAQHELSCQNPIHSKYETCVTAFFIGSEFPKRHAASACSARTQALTSPAGTLRRTSAASRSTVALLTPEDLRLSKRLVYCIWGD